MIGLMLFVERAAIRVGAGLRGTTDRMVVGRLIWSLPVAAATVALGKDG
jgi:hypothetical protein